MTQKKETQKDADIQELTKILVGFITEQKAFNAEQKAFNAEQRIFNQEIDKKIDKVQYFLEESLAQNAKIFLEEQLEMKVEIKELESEITHMKNDMIFFTSQLNMLLAR